MQSNSGSTEIGGNSTLNPEDQAKWETRKKILESKQKDSSSSNNILDLVNFIDTIKPKIENILEYNRANHKRFNLSSKNLLKNGVVPLSKIEIEQLDSLVKSEPNIPKTLCKQVEGKDRPTCYVFRRLKKKTVINRVIYQLLYCCLMSNYAGTLENKDYILYFYMINTI